MSTRRYPRARPTPAQNIQITNCRINRTGVATTNKNGLQLSHMYRVPTGAPIVSHGCGKHHLSSNKPGKFRYKPFTVVGVRQGNGMESEGVNKPFNIITRSGGEILCSAYNLSRGNIGQLAIVQNEYMDADHPDRIGMRATVREVTFVNRSDVYVGLHDALLTPWGRNNNGDASNHKLLLCIAGRKITEQSIISHPSIYMLLFDAYVHTDSNDTVLYTGTNIATIINMASALKIIDQPTLIQIWEIIRNISAVNIYIANHYNDRTHGPDQVELDLSNLLCIEKIYLIFIGYLYEWRFGTTTRERFETLINTKLMNCAITYPLYDANTCIGTLLQKVNADGIADVYIDPAAACKKSY